MTAERGTSQAGFTLIEVVVAFAILALSAGALLSVLSSNPLKIHRAANDRIAVLAAQSVLARLGNEQPVEKGDYRGELSSGVRWAMSIRPYERLQKQQRASSSTTPYLVTVRADVGAEADVSSATLTTVRLKTGAP